MSLDVYLISGKPQVKKSSGIFVREGGSTKEISAEKWNETYPDNPIEVDDYEEETTQVYGANITHNLGAMAGKADLYTYLWRPEEFKITLASELIIPLAKGLVELLSRPDYYRQWNSENGWGTYEQLVQFVKNYLKACTEYPNANIEISR